VRGYSTVQIQGTHNDFAWGTVGHAITGRVCVGGGGGRQCEKRRENGQGENAGGLDSTHLLVTRRQRRGGVLGTVLYCGQAVALLTPFSFLLAAPLVQSGFPDSPDPLIPHLLSRTCATPLEVVPGPVWLKIARIIDAGRGVRMGGGWVGGR